MPFKRKRAVWHIACYNSSMKIAMPIWNNRISPVFDVAKRLILFDVEGGDILNREEIELYASPIDKIRTLTDSDVSILICGAISGPLMMQIRHAGVEVLCNICGPADDVTDAFLKGRLDSERYIMPGCCGRRRRFRSCHNRMQKIIRKDVQDEDSGYSTR